MCRISGVPRQKRYGFSHLMRVMINCNIYKFIKLKGMHKFRFLQHSTLLFDKFASELTNESILSSVSGEVSICMGRWSRRRDSRMDEDGRLGTGGRRSDMSDSMESGREEEYELWKYINIR